MSATKKRKVGDNSEIKKYSTSPELIAFLFGKKTVQLQPKSGIVFVCKRESKVIDVFKGLVKHNFLSVPVLQKTGDKYYGFVDLSDIVRHIISYFGEKRLNQENLNFWELAGKEQPFANLTINDIMLYPLTRRNPFHPVKENYSLLTAVELLARERGLHRIPIVDDHRELVNMITQSQVISFIHDKIDLVGGKRNKPVGQISTLHTPVITINQNEIALDAFEVMSKKKVSGLAVVDDDGVLTGSISLRDLKAINADGRMFWRLYQTVKNFIDKIKKEYKEKHNRPRSVVTVTAKDTLETAIARIESSKVHRVFVVDESKKPLSVLSIKDVLLELLTLD